MSDDEKPNPPKIKRQTRNTRECIIARDGDCWVLARTLVMKDHGDEMTIETYDDHKFKVEKQILLEHSKFFKGLFKPHFANFKDASHPTLMDVDGDVLELVFKVLHDPKTTEGVDNIETDGLWLMISICDQYQINHRLMKSWFVAWYKEKVTSIDECGCHSDDSNTSCVARSLLFPCYAFDHAEAFHEVTKHLVYSSKGHVYERNPTDKRHLSTPIRIVQQLNGARGRVRTLLEKAVYTPVTNLTDKATCPCRYRTSYEFLEELRELKLFPSLEVLAAKTPLNKIIDTLEKFDYQPSGQADLCHYCGHDYNEMVERAIARYKAYFGGLCLDCIAKRRDVENPKDSDEYKFCHGVGKWDTGCLKEEEYRHCAAVGKWDSKCRVQHGEPTWYFSYHARDEKRRFGP